MNNTPAITQAELAVIDCFACPSTGTTFILALTETHRKIVIWGITNRMCYPGEKIYIIDGQLKIGTKGDFFSLILMSNLEASVWKNIKKSMTCPGVFRNKPEICNYEKKCHFASCPYNVQKYIREKV